MLFHNGFFIIVFPFLQIYFVKKMLSSDKKGCQTCGMSYIFLKLILFQFWYWKVFFMTVMYGNC